MANKTVTIRPSGGDYTTLSAAIAGELVANAVLTAAGLDGILTFQPEGSWSSHDTTAVSFSGFTVDATHYPQVVPDSSNIADGVWDDTKYVLEASVAGVLLAIPQNFARITGVQIRNSTLDDPAKCIYVTGTDVRIDRCIVRDAEYAIHINGERSLIRNTLVYRATWGAVGILIWAGGTVQNCIVSGYGRGIYSAYNPVAVKNTAVGSTDDFDYAVTAGGSFVFTTSCSEDGTQSTPTVAWTTDTFANVTGGSEDFTLVTGSALIGAGTDLSADASFPFNYDAAGATRATWDVGTLYFPTSIPSAFGQILVDGTWHTIDTVSICIGAAWKNVTEIQIVNTNAWKALTT